ncbi:MAG: hypothetical protein COA74_11910 [Gammaproteobacteria bacterium]|nr:MAG: hypothetical protein COA74_11910 [Gammaproteobacteria bacterium]
MTALEIGKGRVVREGSDLAILSFGHLLPDALAAAEKLNATVVDMRFIKPLDEAMIISILKSHTKIITLEENAIMGGAGSAVNEFIATQNTAVSIKNIGLPDRFIQHGNVLDLKVEIALTEDGIIQAGRAMLVE